MTEIKKEYAIPLLPCKSINETIEFYTALGFMVTYQQKQPNVYVALKIRDLEIHFFTLKIKPEENFSTCYLIVSEIDELYTSFKKGLKDAFGKVQTKGYPRLNALKDMPTYGVRQFIVVDPSGNYIRIGQPIPKVDSVVYDENIEDKENFAKASQIQKLYEISNRLANGYDDLEKAANVIDSGIKNIQNPEPLYLFKILVVRADIAYRLGDTEALSRTLEHIERIRPSVDLVTVEDELRVLEEIEGT